MRGCQLGSHDNSSATHPPPKRTMKENEGRIPDNRLSLSYPVTLQKALFCMQKFMHFVAVTDIDGNASGITGEALWTL